MQELLKGEGKDYSLGKEEKVRWPWVSVAMTKHCKQNQLGKEEGWLQLMV